MLCKQPGDTTIFATATVDHISLYNLSSVSPLARELSVTPTPDRQHVRIIDSTNEAAADLSPYGNQPCSVINTIVHNACRRPFVPIWRVPFSQVRGSGISGGEDEANRCTPLSLALSCAGGAQRLFVSESGSGAWVGEGMSFSALSVPSEIVTTSAYVDRDTRAESIQYTKSGIQGNDIVTSGWAYRDPTLLAIGRHRGVVQLLRVEGSGSHPSLHTTVVQERVLQGSVTSLDWVPNTDILVVAARRRDEYGCFAEVMDFRSREVAIRYLGAPPGVTPTSSRASRQQQPLRCGVGIASTGALCFAEAIACDMSQKYVAAAGNNNRHDVLQLWDLRMSSRPVSAHVHASLGYTSLSWVSCATPTVVSTTRKRGLWMYTFTDSQSQGGDDSDDSGEEKERRQRLLPSEDRYRLHTRVPAACAASLGGDQAVTPTTGVETSQPGVAASPHKGSAHHRAGKCDQVQNGQHLKLPCLVLLDAASGELYPQVALPRKTMVTMINDIPVWSAGPNVFRFHRDINELLDDMEDDSNLQLRKQKDQHIPDTIAKEPSASAGSLSEGEFEEESGEAERTGGNLLDLLKASVFMNKDYDETTLASLSTTLPAAIKERPNIPTVRRPLLSLRRLREGFVPYSHQVFSVLSHEMADREAYALFRYGWYMQRHIHKGKTITPASSVVPSLLELLRKKPQVQVTEVILRAMGWCIDRDEEALMLQPLDSPTTVRESSRIGVLSPNIVPQTTHQVSGRFHGLPLYCHQRPLASEKGSTMFSSPSASSGSTEYAADVLSQNSLPPFECQVAPSPEVEFCDRVGAASPEDAVERRVAIHVCMGYLSEAARLLSHYSDLRPSYANVALILESAAQGHFPVANIVAPAGCSYWMHLCVELLGMYAHHSSIGGADQGNGERERPGSGWSSASSHMAGRKFFTCFTRRYPQMPLPDQVALATVLLFPYASADSQEQLASGDNKCEESWEALGDILQEMTMMQFDSSLGCSCSLFLSAAVEPLDSEYTSVQRYVDETGDVQTPVVYFALYGSTKSRSWRLWNDAYRTQLNNGGHSILRSIHDLACSKMSQMREKVNENFKSSEYNNSMSFPLAGRDGVVPLASNFVGRTFSGFVGTPTASVISGTEGRPMSKRLTGTGGVVLRCKCGRRVPTFPANAEGDAVEPTSTAIKAASMEGSQQSLCKIPDCLTPMCVVCSEPVFRQKSGYTFEESFTWCTVCLHGGHWMHLREWFVKHRTCPAEDCSCRCYYPLNERCGV